MDVSLHLLLQGILHLLALSLVFMLSLFSPFYQGLPHVLQLFAFEVEVNEVFVEVGLLTDDAGLRLCFDFFESFSRNDVSARPEGDEFIKAIVLKFGDGASNIVDAGRDCFVDDDLSGDVDTFLISLSLVM